VLGPPLILIDLMQIFNTACPVAHIAWHGLTAQTCFPTSGIGLTKSTVYRCNFPTLDMVRHRRSWEDEFLKQSMLFWREARIGDGRIAFICMITHSYWFRITLRLLLAINQITFAPENWISWSLDRSFSRFIRHTTALLSSLSNSKYPKMPKWNEERVLASRERY